MNKTVQSILSLTAVSLLLIVITFFLGGLGFGRLFGIYGVMEDSFLGMLMVIDMLVIYKVYKLYFCQPKAIMLLFGLECCVISDIVTYIQFPTSIGLANNQSVIASSQFGRLRRRWTRIEYACSLMRYDLSAYWDWVFIHWIEIYK